MKDNSNADRLARQLAFIQEAEKLKLVYRRNGVVGRSRRENAAEHSWHVALMAVVLAEHADARSLDWFKVTRMLLVHDLVEIYAGDTWLYAPEAGERQAEKEAQSASKLFGILPEDQAAQLRALWEEFEERRTPEAAFAASIDALQPLINHLLTGDPESSDPRPLKAAVLDRKRHIGESSQALWELWLNASSTKALRSGCICRPALQTDP